MLGSGCHQSLLNAFEEIPKTEALTVLRGIGQCVYSLNVAIPGEIHALTERLRPQLLTCDTIRDTKTLVVKRFPATDRDELTRAQKKTRDALRGTDPFRIRVTGVEQFEIPASGDGPVLFLAIDSPALEAIHDRLVTVFDAAPGIEGEDYRPHITIARGGDPEVVEDILQTEIEPLSVAVNRLIYWDAQRNLPTGELRLPVQ